MGLFVVSELVKRTAGRFLISCPGGSLYIEGDPNYESNHAIKKSDASYPGTLIAFEISLIGPEESPFPDVHFSDILAAILADADRMRPGRVSTPVLRFEEPPAGALQCFAQLAIGDLDKSAAMRDRLLQALVKRTSVAIDFMNVRLATQSQVHAILFEPIRVAHSLSAPVYAMNCSREVRTVLEFLQGYALG
jgi:hypothetical protein